MDQVIADSVSKYVQVREHKEDGYSETSFDVGSSVEMTGNPCAEWELEREGIYPLKPGASSLTYT